MADSEPTCPRTRAAYEKARPVIEKLPAELAQNITAAANKACVMEGSATALASIAQFATKIGRIR